MLAEMRSVARDSYGFIKRGSALLLEVKARFQREKESVFDRMRDSFNADVLAELGGLVAAVKELPPRSPTTTRTSLPLTSGQCPPCSGP